MSDALALSLTMLSFRLRAALRGCTRALRACPWPCAPLSPIPFWELALGFTLVAYTACLADGFLRARRAGVGAIRSWHGEGHAHKFAALATPERFLRRLRFLARPTCPVLSTVFSPVPLFECTAGLHLQAYMAQLRHVCAWWGTLCYICRLPACQAM